MSKRPLITYISLSRLLEIDDFASQLHRTELVELDRQFPAFRIMYVRFQIGESFFNYLLTKKERRGEVVFALQNTEKKILLHTKPQFPSGLYRLLTGGIDIGEPLISSLKREVFEETGFQFSQYYFNGIVAIVLENKNRTYPFVSYTFTIQGIDSEPVVMDKSENISGFKWVSLKELDKVFYQLAGLDEWYDWGVLRSLPHLLINPKLKWDP